MDHVSDSFLETNVPLLVLIEAAKNGNEKEVKEYAQVFREHANKLIEVIPFFYDFTPYIHLCTLLFISHSTVVDIFTFFHIFPHKVRCLTLKCSNRI